MNYHASFTRHPYNSDYRTDQVLTAYCLLLSLGLAPVAKLNTFILSRLWKSYLRYHGSVGIWLKMLIYCTHIMHIRLHIRCGRPGPFSPIPALRWLSRQRFSTAWGV